MLKWRIGNVSITRVVELEAPTSPRFLFESVSKVDLLGIEWLKPHFVTEKGHMVLSIHALLLASKGRRIIVDTCLGNDKERSVEGWACVTDPFYPTLPMPGFRVSASTR